MASWRELIMLAGVALAFSFVLVFFIHHMAAFVSWIILIFVSISMLMVTTVLWWTYFDIKYQLNTVPLFDRLDENLRNEKSFLVLSIVSTIGTAVMLLIVLVMRKRVQLVVALFQEAGACIRAMPGLLFQPLWTLIVLMSFLAFWLCVLLALASADHATRRERHIELPARRPTFYGLGDGS